MTRQTVLPVLSARAVNLPDGQHADRGHDQADSGAIMHLPEHGDQPTAFALATKLPTGVRLVLEDYVNDTGRDIDEVAFDDLEIVAGYPQRNARSSTGSPLAKGRVVIDV